MAFADTPTTSPPVAAGLRRFMRRFAGAIVATTLLFGSISYLLLQEQLTRLNQHLHQQRLQAAVKVLQQRLLFYRDVIDGYAQDPAVAALFDWPDPQQAMAWSALVRSNLPNVIGAALFDRDGEIYGDPVRQRLGWTCITDLQLRLDQATAATVRPLVHGVPPDNAHFDLSATILSSNGKAVGLVFLSFPLSEMRRALDRLVDESHALALVERDSGRLLSASENWSQFDATAQLQQQVTEAVDSSEPHPLVTADPFVDHHGSDEQGGPWVLQLRYRDDSLLPALPQVGNTIVAGMLVVVLLLLLTGHLLLRSYRREIVSIQQRLRTMIATRSGESPPVDSGSEQGLFPLRAALDDALDQLGDAHQSLQRQSLADATTGLANRRAFDLRMDEMINCLNGPASRHGFTLLLLDLDNFKQANDRFGHAAGDAVLQALAAVLQQHVRQGDLVTRWGGDEFALLLPGMSESACPGWIARVREQFDVAQQQLPALGGEACCGLSCGYLWIGGEATADEPEQWLRRADERLYADKRARRAAAEQARRTRYQNYTT